MAVKIADAQKILQVVSRLYDSHHTLCELWMDIQREDGTCKNIDEILSPEYPYEKCFYEMLVDVGVWAESIYTKINRHLPEAERLSWVQFIELAERELAS